MSTLLQQIAEARLKEQKEKDSAPMISAGIWSGQNLTWASSSNNNTTSQWSNNGNNNNLTVNLIFNTNVFSQWILG